MIKIVKNKKLFFIALITLLVSIVIITKIYINTTDNKDNNIELPSYVDSIIINDDFFNSMSEKEVINYKILNSIDFFKNVTGKYTYTDKISKYNEVVKYCADIENKKSYVSIISDDGNTNEEIIYKDNIQRQFDNIKNLYTDFQGTEYVVNENIRKLKPKDRYNKKNGEFIDRRDGDFLVQDNITLFNQEIQSYLKNYDNWEIEGDIDYLNRKSILINGKLGFTGKSGENKFKIIVDKETGIILNLDFLDKDNNTLMSMETNEINIDKNIDPSIFEKSTDAYKN
ncbi:hypothetical protein [Clostridium weizhouense]|uniref:Uncharacterized protein n=1 Tax=Clostridium weizhouense TaxID=2859781 RepID=A0ABS7ASZ4_9CLOT|nr:hypothetical protein [Clostridium weizhouense]MBW6411664.1 hypothetical protein [Clostridium weizhouense]